MGCSGESESEDVVSRSGERCAWPALVLEKDSEAVGEVEGAVWNEVAREDVEPLLSEVVLRGGTNAPLPVGAGVANGAETGTKASGRGPACMAREVDEPIAVDAG